ncbi:MAG: kelch repeat-containing protein, partial [Micromonosporaceae bacterium]
MAGQRRASAVKCSIMVVAVLASLLSLATAGPVEAAPGDLDPTFSGGTVLGAAGLPSAVARQADGKLLVGGFVNTSPSNSDWRLTRLNTNGTVDTSFGSNGVVTTDLSLGDVLTDVVVQSDGKILIAGSTRTPGFNRVFTLARYEPNGIPDATFGVAGVVTTTLQSDSAANAVAVQTDGKIVAAGHATDGTGRAFAVVRYLANGSLDATFGANGSVVTTVAGGPGTGAYGLAVLADGKLVVSGCSGSNADGNCSRLTLARYGSTGALDSAFGTTGIAVGPTGLNGSGGRLAVQESANPAQVKLVTVGSGAATQLAARFSATGALDASFGGDGVVDTVAGSANAVLVDSEGRVSVAGSRSDRFLIGRHDETGAMDGAFGENGVVTTGFAGHAGITDMLSQPDGRIVAVGVAEGRFAVARYETAPAGGEVADVSASAADSPDPVGSGGTLTYNLGVANNGPDSAYRLVATAALPAGSAFVSATPSQGLCTEASGTLTCELNGLVAGASLTVTVVVNPGPSGQAVLNLAVSTSSSDPSSGNNGATATTTVTPGAGEWISTIPGLGTARKAPAVGLSDGRVLVAGGVVEGAAVATAEVYDPVTGTSSPTGSLSGTRYDHTLTALPDGRVLAAGGLRGFTRLTSAEIWDPATGTWSSTGSMAVSHTRHTAVLLNTGKVLVVGGMDLSTTLCPGPSGVENSAERYDPASGTWSPTGNMMVPRVHHTTTKLADGRVLAVSGYIPTGYQGACGVGVLQQNAPVELYNPTTNSWSQPIDMAIRRNKHAATLLSDGSVLVSGGNP